MKKSSCIEQKEICKRVLKLIQPVLDSMSEMQGIWLKFVDTSGEYILTSQTTNPCRFCCLIRSTPAGLRMCHDTARRAVKQSKQYKGPIKSRCHAGLTTVTVPIMINENCLGALMAGEIVEENLYGEIKQHINKTARNLQIRGSELMKCFEEIPKWSTDKINVITRSLDAVSNCFIEVGVTVSNNEKTELEKHLKDMELKALQNQINPHFLFNTLNTIEMLSVMEGAIQTSHIVHALAQLFRRNLHISSDLVTIGQELESVDHYLTIQRCRFGERLEIINNIPPYMLEFNIPALALQPLVENAVVHGLEPREEKGCLRLDGYSELGDIVLQVTDNGVGIAREQLDQIRLLLKNTNVKTNKLGLQNVQKRCLLHYKSPYGISITSAPGRGTSVTLRLPAQTSRVGVNIEAANS